MKKLLLILLCLPLMFSCVEKKDNDTENTEENVQKKIPKRVPLWRLTDDPMWAGEEYGVGYAIYTDKEYEPRLEYKDGLSYMKVASEEHIIGYVSFTGIGFSLFNDGVTVSEEITFVNGIKEGLEKEWFKNGKLRYEGNMKNNKEDGVSRYYHENGTLSWEVNYKNGVIEGLEKEWFENGKLRYEGNMKNNKVDGVSKEYCEHGNSFIYNSKDGVSISLKCFDRNNNETNCNSMYRFNTEDPYNKCYCYKYLQYF